MTRLSMKNMRYVLRTDKLTLLTLSIVTGLGAIALSACTHDNPPTAQNSSPAPADVNADTTNHSGMNHGSMNHSDLGPADETFDLRFIDGMILHHQGALNMAEDALQKSTRPEIKQLSEQIIAAQEKEIAQMQTWRKAWYPSAAAEPQMYHAAMNHQMAMTPEDQAAMRMDMDLGAADAQYDLRFIDAMVPHHEGALVMAREALEKSKRPEIRQLAEAILRSQQPEIDQMNQWRKEWYGQ